MWMRRVSSAVLDTVVLLVAGLVPSASAIAPAGSKITVRISDPTPASGQTMVLRGRYLLAGSPAAGHKVKVQTYRNGGYDTISGATVLTRSDGRYRVRLVLQARGVRDLRAVGVAGGHRENSYHRFVVEVH